MYGRNGEAPVAVIAPRTPGDCFDAALEAARIALTYRTPVFLLSDGYLANGSEPWRIPDLDELPDLRVQFAQGPNHTLADGTTAFWPYLRDPQTLARPWAIPGTPAWNTASAASRNRTAPATSPTTPPTTTSWSAPAKPRSTASPCPTSTSTTPTTPALPRPGLGSTYGPITAAVRRLRTAGQSIAQAHLRHLNPFPANLGDVLHHYDTVVVPEMNLGQLTTLIRATYLVDARPHTQINGMPFKAEQLATALQEAIDG